MVKGLSIVEQNDYKAEAKRIAKNEIRKNELEKKAKEGGLSTAEKLELAALKIGGFLDNDVFLNSQSLFGKKTGLTSCNVKNDYEPDLDSAKTTDSNDMPLIQHGFNSPEMKELLQRGNAGLDGSVIEEIANLPKKHAKLFLKKDEKGNYMIPTGILNKFAKSGMRIFIDECTRLVIKATDPVLGHPALYSVYEYFNEVGDCRGKYTMVIEKIDTITKLITDPYGRYRLIDDSIDGYFNVRTGNTSSLDCTGG